MKKGKWIKEITSAGFKIEWHKYSLFGFKEKWDYSNGNLFIRTCK